MSSSRWLVLLIAWLGWVFDIMDTALFNLAKGQMLLQLVGPSFPAAERAALEGRIQTIFILGWAIGGLIFGVLADRWSRTKTLALTVGLYAIFTALTAFCTSWEQVAGVRFLTGLGIGGEWAAGAALVAEAFSDSFRPTAAAILQTAAAFGPWAAALLNYLIMGRYEASRQIGFGSFLFYPWQWMFLVGVAPAILAFLLRSSLGHHEKVESTPEQPGGLKELLSNPQWIKLAIGVMLVGTVGIAGAGNAAYWLPNLVQGASPGMSGMDVASRVTQATFVMHLGTLLGVFFFPYIAQKYGRKISLGAGFLMGFFLTVFALGANPGYNGLLIVFPLIAFSAIGLTSVFGLYFPELFPSRMRATGAGLGYNAARLFQAPIPWITGLLIQWQKGNDSASIAIGVSLAGFIYLAGFLALMLLPETRAKPLPA